MKTIACMRFAAVSSSINACWAQFANFDQGVSSAVEGFVGSYINQASQTIIYTPVELPSNVASPVNVASSTGGASDSSVSNAISTTAPSAAVTLSTKTAATTTPISTPSATTTSPPSTTSTANPPSATPSPGLRPSARVGIGVGVPLGVIGVAVIGFLVQRHRRHKRISRLGHQGNLAAGLYPVIDETDEKVDVIDVEDSSGLQALERNGVYEIHGTEIPAYSRELPGSPGVPRHEFGTWNGPE